MRLFFKAGSVKFWQIYSLFGEISWKK